MPLGSDVGDESSERDPIVLRQRVADLRAELTRTRQGTHDFVSMLAHELRTPLGAILMWAHVLRVGRESDRTTAIDAIETSAQDQSILIGKVLDLTRALAGRLRMDQGIVDLASVVSAAVEDSKALAAVSETQVQVLHAVDASLLVRGDATRLRAVICALIGSALRRTPSQGQVEVAVSSVGERVIVTVRDGAPALSVEQASVVFTPFSLSGDPFPGPVALDLALVRLLVDLHQGTIHAAGLAGGQGNLFTLNLPRAASAQVATRP